MDTPLRSKYVYQMVTNDQYESVIYQADSCRELSLLCGIPSDKIRGSIRDSHRSPRRRRDIHRSYKFTRVEIGTHKIGVYDEAELPQTPL